MAWYLNSYECSYCGTHWTDGWSCMCDDECPACGASDFSPINSDDLSAFTEKNDDGKYSIYYSLPEAGHKPNFTLLATVSSMNIAKLLEQIAFDLAKPK